jgi:hypothetical protein
VLAVILSSRDSFQVKKSQMEMPILHLKHAWPFSWITMRNSVVWNKLCTREVIECKEEIRIFHLKAVLSSPRSGSSCQFWYLRIHRLRCPPQSSLLSCIGVLDWNNWIDKCFSGSIIVFTISFE